MEQHWTEPGLAIAAFLFIPNFRFNRILILYAAKTVPAAQSRLLLPAEMREQNKETEN